MEVIVTSRKGWAIALVGLVALAAAGCSGSKVTTKASSQLPKYRVQRVAVLPFDALTTPQAAEATGPLFQVPHGAEGSNISVATPPAQELAIRSTATVPSFAGEKIAQLLWSRLRSQEGVVALSPDESSRAVKELEGKEAGIPREAMASKVAARLSVDAAVVGRVLVYQERVGSRLGANPAAAVGFEVKLIAADRTLLWEGNYYEKQRPMTEDLMGFFAHGFGFVTADELAIYGADQLAKEFPFGQAARSQ